MKQPLKKLVFPKGVTRIYHPVAMPFGGIMCFYGFALESIAKVSSKYQPRKNVIWDFKASFLSDSCEVIAIKTK